MQFGKPRTSQGILTTRKVTGEAEFETAERHKLRLPAGHSTSPKKDKV